MKVDGEYAPRLLPNALLVRLLWITGVSASLGLAWYSISLLLAPIAQPWFLGERLRDFPVAMNAHIVFASVAMALLPVLLSTSARSALPRLHFVCGYLYVVSVVVSAVCALPVVPFVPGGTLGASAFFVLAIAWIYSVARVVASAVQHHASSHRRWTLRSAALSFSGVTLRVCLLLAPTLDWKSDLSLGLIAWSSWLINLIVVEVWLRHSPQPGVSVTG